MIQEEKLEIMNATRMNNKSGMIFLFERGSVVFTTLILPIKSFTIVENFALEECRPTKQS